MPGHFDARVDKVSDAVLAADRARDKVRKARRALTRALEASKAADLERAAALAEITLESFRVYTGNPELTEEDVDLMVWREALAETYETFGVDTDDVA